MDRASFFTRPELRRFRVRTFGGIVVCAAAAAAHATDDLAIHGTPSESARVGVAYSFTPTVSDPSKKKLKFMVWEKPKWASFSSTTGRLSGTPTAADVGTQSDIRIGVSDEAVNAYLPFFHITVSATDDLAIHGTPSESARVGVAYSFTPTVSDPSKKKLQFAIGEKPKWATFSTTTGKLSGTPTAADVGTYNAIHIMVSDPEVHAYLPFFHITVSAAADKPVISGAPATHITAGSAYRFQPSAKDPDGKRLSFTVEHKPAWASFSIATGLLEGTPSSKQTGAYDDIVISASNGQYSTALPAFNVTVAAATSTAPATGTAKLSWKPPSENTNGSKLTDLAGVRIYYGTSESDLSHSVQVAGTSTTTYTVSGLTAGTWYFGAEAYTTAGTTSHLSAIVAASVP
jgi:Putative Ig domain